MRSEDKSIEITGPFRPFSFHGHRILVVAPQPFYENRGTPIALRKVLEAVSHLGHRVDLLTFPVGENVRLRGLRIHRVGKRLPVRSVPIGFSLRKALLDLFLLPAILRRTRKFRYRYIYALEEAAFLALLLRGLHGLPLIYDMQSSLPEQLRSHWFFGRALPQRALKAVERWTIRNSERVVCSAGLREHVLAVEPAADVREWFFPVDPSTSPDSDPGQLRKELDIEPGSGVVVYAGNFASYQGVGRILDAALAVVEEVPGTVFVLVGDEPSSPLSLSKAADQLMKLGALRVIHRQPQSVIGRFLAMADVVVSPRDDTGNVGLKVFEYMAAGKPIVATDTAAHRAVLAEDRAVLVGLSPGAMAGGIVRLLRDRGEGRRLGDSAKAFADKFLTHRAFEDRVAGLYEADKA